MSMRKSASVTAALVLGAAILPLIVLGVDERQPSSTVKGAAASQATEFKAINKDLKDLPKIPKFADAAQGNEANPRKHYGREGRLARVPKPAPKRDALLDFQVRASTTRLAAALTAGAVNVDGQGFTGVNPPDTVGDVGPGHFIQAINMSNGTSYTVYNKATGAVIAGPFLLSDLGGMGVNGLGDPIVLYDQLAKRWLLAEFSNNPNGVHVYISKTTDPVSGGWFHYQFKTNLFPDYPKFGVWSDGYYFTSNESTGPAVYALERTKMLAGDATASMQRFEAPELAGFGFQALTPADADDEPPAGSPFYLLRHHDDEVHNAGSNNVTQDFLDLFELKIDWGTPANSTLIGAIGLPVSEFDSDLNGLSSFSCFPQPGTTVRLDPLREVIMHRVQYRKFAQYEAMVGSFVTDVDGNDHGGIRWFELRKDAQSGWRVHQEGTFAPDSHNRWMSSIAMDGSGNIGMAYNVSSTTVFPSIRYTGRKASDPMGAMRPELTLIDGTVANDSFRYGDYASVNVDPSDNKTFWYTGEYNASVQWSTRIGTFLFP